MTADRRIARVRAVCAAAGAAGLTTTALVAWASGGRVDRPWLAVGFALALVLAEYFPLHVTHEADSEALRIEEAFFVPMAVLLAPLEVLGAIAVSTLVVHAAHRRGLLKGVFNVGMITAAAGLGLAVTHLIGLAGPPWRDLVAAVAGGLVFCLSSAVAVSGVISVAQGERFARVLGDGALVRAATWLGSLCLGALVVLAVVGSGVALLVAIVPAVVLQFAYAGALRQWRERRQAEALYAAAGRIRSATGSADVRDELIRAARELLAAGTARIVPLASVPASAALRARLDDETAVEVCDRATGGAWTKDDESRLQALAAVAGSALAQALLYEQLRSITRSLGEGVLALDPSGTITFANPTAELLLGWAPGELVGRDITSTVDPAAARGTDAPVWVHLPRVLAGETVRLDEHVVARADARPLDVGLTASPVVREGAVVGAVVVFRDVRERKALERRLVHQAFHDPLTGLPNRALFLDRLEHAQVRRRDARSVQAVLFVDLDRFKLVNDSLGHRAGDDVLCTVASRMVGVLREGDTVARFGGDEFTVLLEQLASPEEATLAAERIVQALRVPFRVGERDVVLSASIGVAVAHADREAGDLLAAADIAMYEAKTAGKDRWSVAAAGADDRALARLELEMELRRAIAEGELELHYQPVVHADGSGLYGLEALVRWRHPTLGLLTPGAFMDLAEDTGLVLPLGEWVLKQACRDARAWHDRHPDAGTVFAVNLSAVQFQQPDLRALVADVLAETGLDPARLVLEITETVVMQDSETVLATLDALRSLRVNLAVDDFGTGYSSLSYLKRFPVDTIKIDKSFVDGLASSAVDREIVSAVVRLARAVGMHTVAEGVETTRQLELLRQLGCSSVQGFLISAPQPLRDVERKLADIAPLVPRPRAEHRRLRSLS